MTRVNHPAFPNVSRDVPEDAVAAWESSGWVRDAPAPEPEAAATGWSLAPVEAPDTPAAGGQ